MTEHTALLLDRHDVTNQAEKSPWRPAAAPHQGMPPLAVDGAQLSFFEFWPMWAFYPPVALYAAWLMVRYRSILLPTIANPSFPGGGFFGESKADILKMAVQHAPKWVAPFVQINLPAMPANDPVSECDAALAAMANSNIALPVVAKPDLGCRGAGVKLMRTRADLQAYLAAFPRGASLVLQKLVPFEGEAGVFYVRHPAQKTGKITGMVLRQRFTVAELRTRVHSVLLKKNSLSLTIRPPSE